MQIGTVTSIQKTMAKSTNILPERIIEVAESTLEKLSLIRANEKLISEIDWCIGSYKHDQNPAGLFDKLKEAIVLFKAAQAKKTKGITAKFIGDIEKVLG
jgi:hypothetical protein